MHYTNFGLATTKQLLTRALRGGYAVPAFNFYNMETLTAILKAAEITQSPVILAVSESAIEYMGPDILMGMIAGAKYRVGTVALHLDHGHSFESCKRAIDLGFSSVMFDGSNLPLPENIKISRRVADYAHKFGVSVESELGVLSGIEDENTYLSSPLGVNTATGREGSSYRSLNKGGLVPQSLGEGGYTNPAIVKDFVKQTQTDSLAIAIGTSHGAYKRKSENESLRFDILEKIAENIPNIPLVLHGASSVPQKYVKNINKFGGDIKNARGIAPAQLRRTISLHVAKINIDSDSRLAFTSAIREYLFKHKNKFNPREYIESAKDEVIKNCITEIQNIMGSGYKG